MFHTSDSFGSLQGLKQRMKEQRFATVDGKSRTISESSIRRNLKLNDEEGISSLPDAELFENLALMGYNILPNQKFTFQKAQDLEISNLKARIKIVEDKDKGSAELSGDDAPIKGRSLETGDEAGVERSIERKSNKTEEMVNVLTSMDAANILTSGVQAVSVPPVAEVSTVGLVPTVSAIFTTASVVTPYSRRKDLIDGLDKNNEVIAKHLQEYKQSAAELTIGEKIDLINELVKYQDHHSKILRYQAQQSKPLSKKQQREFYMSVLRSHSGWKTKHFKEEGEKVKRKGLRLEQDSAKKMKTSEEVSKEDLKEMMQLVHVEEVYVEALQVKHPIIDWEIHTEGKRDYWKIIRLGGNITVYQFFVDMLKQLTEKT
nr:hypothetical protein [Tanacetum cinerariifolium]